MLDRFDTALLDLLQQDAAQTADRLAEQVPLSPSAIARRLRRLRADRWIDRIVALLPPRLHARRLRALALIQLSEHANLDGQAALRRRLIASPQVQFCYETTGGFDMLAMFDCESMTEFTELTEAILLADPTVHRFQTHLVKREIKFAPFVRLSAD